MVRKTRRIKLVRRKLIIRKFRRGLFATPTFFPSVERDVQSSHKAADEMPGANIGNEDFFGDEPHFSLRDIL